MTCLVAQQTFTSSCCRLEHSKSTTVGLRRQVRRLNVACEHNVLGEYELDETAALLNLWLIIRHPNLTALVVLDAAFERAY